jgi:hypothetical protein
VYTGTAQVRIHAALDKTADWTESRLVSLNESKPTYTVFSLSNKKQKVKLALKGMVLKEELTPTYLGVIFYRSLTWKEQINRSCTKANFRLSIMKYLAGTDWGADPKNTQELLHWQSKT